MKIFSPILKGTTTVAQGTTNLSGSFTGSLFGTAATASYADNFTVGGTLTAQTINVQIITSSIEFNTGSTRNGALSTNTHQFTGSVLMSGSVGIGTSTPDALLTVAGANQASGAAFNTYGNALIYSTDSFAINKGGALSLGGKYNSAGTPIATFARIHGKKENATVDSTSGYLSFETVPEATALLTERMRINSVGNVGIGTTSPDVRLHISGSDGIKIQATGNSDTPSLTIINNTNQYGWARFGGGLQGNGRGYAAVSCWNGSTIGEVIRISGDGNVGIGTSTVTTAGGAHKGMEIFGASGASLVLSNGGGNKSYLYTDGSGTTFYLDVPGAFTITVAAVERMRISATGYLKLKTVSSTYSNATHRLDDYQSAQGNVILVSGNAEQADSFIAYSVSQANQSAAGTAVAIGRNSSTGRSINAGGTINASGADYAEYMIKAIADNIVKGDIVGINSEGKLTNIFNDAISFAVKSTDPAYVGNDSWGSVGSLNKPISLYTEEELQQYKITNEAIRSTVDRIAFSGQVPCNVTGSNVGDYIIPIQTGDGKITGQAVASPSFEQYQISVGKVWKIMEDGRAWIAVKIG
jgi:hypothetical protein